MVLFAKFQLLLTAVNTIPVTTAEFERNFKGMNFCMSPQRKRLQADHLSTLLFKFKEPPSSKIQTRRICEDMAFY